MPLPKRLAAPFRRSSYTCFSSRRSSFLSKTSTKPHPSTTIDPPIRPHYFDAYTGTWSPRQTTSTPTRRSSGLWSPRQIASRIATPARRPASPTSTTSPPRTPLSTSTTATDAAPLTPGSERSLQQLRYRAYQPFQYQAGSLTTERPPSRGKGAGTVTLASATTTPASPAQSGLDWARITEENEDESDGADAGEDARRLAGGKLFSVTKVPLPAREDVRPQSRDWADPLGGWGVIDVIAGGGGYGNADGEGVEEGKVFLPAVVHEMSVLPVVERVA